VGAFNFLTYPAAWALALPSYQDKQLQLAHVGNSYTKSLPYFTLNIKHRGLKYNTPYADATVAFPLVLEFARFQATEDNVK
jgi:hypothetical protein